MQEDQIRLLQDIEEHMRHASLFSGIGGPEVAASMLGWDNVFHCEINPFGRAVLEYWFPESKSYEDITKTDFREWRGKVDVLTGGFPCQPFSYAGKRGGREDERYLWPQMLRVIDEIRPTWVVGENVAGITTMVEGGVLTPMGCDTTLFGEGDGLYRYELRQSFTIERICRDLEGLGYSVQPMLIPAASVGAPHRRDRIFILAHVADTDCGYDLRGSGEDEGKGKGLSERHSIRKSGEPDQLRSEVQGIDANTVGGRCPAQEEGERAEGSRCKGYVFPKQRRFTPQRFDGLPPVQGDATNSDGDRGDKVHEYLQPELADGAEPIGNGREHDATHPSSKMCNGRRTQTGREREADSNDEEYSLQPSIIGSRTERIVTHANCEGREESIKSRREENSEEDRARLDDRTERLGGYLLPEERWADFPTVSPVHAGNDGIQISLDRIAVYEERNSMDRDSVIIGALQTGKIEVDYESGKIYSTRIRGHEGERIELKGAECNGYIVHTLSFKGVKKQVRAHQVVWMAANGSYDKDTLQIDHINRNRKDNRLSNLRLVTAQENIQNSDRSNTGILTEEQKAAIFQLFHEGNMTMREIAEDFGISKSLVFNVVHEFPSLSIPFSKWRTEALKAYGNAIVPQVMYRIFQAIEQS